MSHNMKRNHSNYRARRLFIAALVFACAAVAIPRAHAQSVASPATPAIITPPPGNSAFLMGQAVGTQGYICLPTTAGASTASWTVKSSRPEATLFQRVFGQDIQIVTHFLSPDANPNDAAPNPLPFGSATWQSSWTAAKSGRRCCIRTRFPPAPTRVARTPARFPA